jgi:outer membrane protein TolC
VLHVYTRDHGLMERYARIAEKRYGVGEVSQADALRAQVEVTRLANRVSSQTLAIASEAATLNALLSRPPDEPLGVPEDPPAPRLDGSPNALVELAVARRPELVAQGAAIARDETGVRLAQRERLPDFEVAGSRFVNYGSRDGFGAFVSVTVPLVQKGRYDAAVSEAEARLAAARADRRRLEDGIRRDVTMAFLRARNALDRHALHVSTHIPQAEQALRVTEGGYQAGSVDFGTLTDTARAATCRDGRGSRCRRTVSSSSASGGRTSMSATWSSTSAPRAASRTTPTSTRRSSSIGRRWPRAGSSVRARCTRRRGGPTPSSAPPP